MNDFREMKMQLIYLFCRRGNRCGIHCGRSTPHFPVMQLPIDDTSIKKKRHPPISKAKNYMNFSKYVQTVWRKNGESGQIKKIPFSLICKY